MKTINIIKPVSFMALLAVVAISVSGFVGCSGDAFQKYQDARFDPVNPPVPDTAPPSVKEIDVTTYKTINVVFNEDIDTNTIDPATVNTSTPLPIALNPANYHIQGINRVMVNSVDKGSDSKSVTLTLSADYLNGMKHGKDYTLLVQHVQDLSKNAILTDFATFVGRGQVYAEVKYNGKAMPNESPWPYINSANITFTVAGDGVIAYMYSFDDGVWYSEKKLSDSNSIAFSSLSEGFHTLKVIGKNSEGIWQDANQATVVSFNVDTIPPVAVLGHLPLQLTTSSEINITVGGDGVTSYIYRINDEPWSNPTASTTAIRRVALADATYTIYVRGYDDAGNYQATDTIWFWRVSASGVIASLSGLPEKSTRSTSLGITVSGNGVNYYKYAVNGVWSELRSATLPITATNLREGSYILQVTGWRTTDPSTAGDTVSYSWTVDITPPVCTISNIPLSPSSSQEAHIIVSSDAGDVVAYKYRLNVGTRQGGLIGPFAVSTPIDLSSLPENQYTIVVMGIDAAGNEQPEASGTQYTWIVDITPPTAQLVGLPATLTNVNNYSVSVSGAGVVAYKYLFDDGSGVTTWSGEILASSLIEGIGLPDGMYTLSVIARDQAGNWQSMQAATEYTWTVDTTPPVAELGNKPPSVTSNPNINISVGGVGVVKYQYQIDGGTWSAEKSRIENGVVTTISLPNPLDPGSHTINVIGIDLAGNKQSTDPSKVTSYSWTVDSTIPTAVFGNIPDRYTRLNNISISVSGCVSYKYLLDSGTWSLEFTSATDQITASGLSEGDHFLMVIGKDSSGLWQDVSIATTCSWTVDTIAPFATISGVAPLPDKYTGLLITTSLNNAVFSISGNDVFGYRVAHLESTDPAGVPTIDKYGTEIIMTADPVTHQLSFSNLSNGEHRIYVIARDQAGNWQDAASPTLYTWTVDTTVPVASLPVIASPTNNTALNVTVGGTDVVSYQYRLDGGSWSIEFDISSPITRVGLPDGTHTLDVIGKNSMGTWQSSTTPTTRSWTVDTSPPSTGDISFVLSNLPANPTSDNFANIKVSGITTGVIAKIKYKLNSGVWSGEINVDQGTAPALYAPISLTGLSDNDYTINVIACDAAGNWMDPANAKTYSWRVDSLQPIAVINTGAFKDPTNVNTFNLTIRGTSIIEYQYQIDGGGWSGWTAVGALNLGPLADGSHTLQVRGRKPGSLVEPSILIQRPDQATTLIWTVDTIAPVVTLSNTPISGSVTDISLNVGGTDVIAYQYSIDPPGSPTDQTWWNTYGLPQVSGSLADRTVDYPVVQTLATGDHTLYVRGRDAAGNWSAPVPCAWTIIQVNLTASATIANGLFSSGLLTFTWNQPVGTGAVLIEIASSSDFTANVARVKLGNVGSYSYLPTNTDIDTYYARVWVSRNAAALPDWDLTNSRPLDASWMGPGSSSAAIKVVGDITGKVIDPSAGNTAVAGVTVKVYDQKNSQYVKDLTTGLDIAVNTDATGSFTITNVPIRTMTGNKPYYLDFSKTGYYATRKNNVTVSRGEMTDAGIIYISGIGSGGTVTGSVINANDGSNISGATVSLLNSDGTVAATGTSAPTTGAFSLTYTGINLPLIYSLKITDTGYFDFVKDNVVVNGTIAVGKQAICEILVEPQVRVVLLWGAQVSAPSSRSGAVTNGSAQIKSLSSTSDLQIGEGVSGTKVPGGATILSIDSSSQITISANCTGTQTSTLTFTAVQTSPSDIDLHLVGPTSKTTTDGTPTNRFHIGYVGGYSQVSYDELAGVYSGTHDASGTISNASWVLDCTTYEGPEAMNIFRGRGVQYAKGMFTYTLYKYNSAAPANSGWGTAPITMRVYDSGGMVVENNFPSNPVGITGYWKALKINIQGNSRNNRRIFQPSTFYSTSSTGFYTPSSGNYATKSAMDW